MAQILVSDLTFCYDGSFGNIFEHASFSIDTDWKLGFLGRNGKGKSTFLALLQGKYEYQGVISASTSFDYFPYKIPDFRMGECASAFLDELKSGCEEWRVLREMDALAAEAELLYRPFQSLSFGERTKVLLAILFSGENDFPLIDEPTNHLDMETRETVKRYLRGKKGFILVSHDRDLLDACVDHVLVLNRKTIEVQSGNFSTWWENKKRKDSFAQAENEKHLREIDSLKKAADRTRRWADLNENTKIGFDPVKEPDRCKDTRAFIGAKTKKAQARVLAYEKRIGREIEEKEGLLQDIENPAALKLYPLTYHKERLLYAKNLELSYEGRGEPVLSGLSFEMGRGERVLLQGINGSGKSTLIHAILSEIMKKSGEQGTRAGKATPRGINFPESVYDCGADIIKHGELMTGAGLTISYVNQDTSFLRGGLRDFCRERSLDESLFYALLRQLDMERVQFSKSMEDFSEGQKKKVLIAASLLTSAHLYIWDEPLNYIDVFSRMQIEEMILRYEPTMLLVEHDVRFGERIATRAVRL